MKRLFLCFALALLAIQLCVLPAMASVYQEPGRGTLPLPLDSGVNVTTLPATDVANNSATLNSIVNIESAKTNNGSNLTYVDLEHRYMMGYFQYGTATGVYTSITPNITREYFLPNPSATFRVTVTGLRPCTKYFVRFVVSNLTDTDYQKSYNDYLISFLSSSTHGTGMHGLGVGLGFTPDGEQLNQPATETVYGNEITFTTTGCQISSQPMGSGGVGTGAPAVTITNPILMSNIVVQSATIATPRAAPGEKVDVAASVINKGSSNGDAKVTLYVNGQEMDSQGVTLASGQTSPVHFSLSMNEPGTYTVSVGSVPAGSFTVDAFANNDFLIYGLIALFTVGIAVVIYMVTRKRTA